MAPMAMSSRVPRSSSTAEASRFEVARLSGKTPPCNLTSQLGSLPPKNRAYEWSRWEWMWWRDDGTLATGRSTGTERFADWCRRSWSECLPDEIECTFSASTIVISRNYCFFLWMYFPDWDRVRSKNLPKIQVRSERKCRFHFGSIVSSESNHFSSYIDKLLDCYV